MVGVAAAVAIGALVRKALVAHSVKCQQYGISPSLLILVCSCILFVVVKVQPVVSCDGEECVRCVTEMEPGHCEVLNCSLNMQLIVVLDYSIEGWRGNCKLQRLFFTTVDTFQHI